MKKIDGILSGVQDLPEVLPPLSRSALKSLATAPEKELDMCTSHVRWETPRGRYDECSSKFSLRKETKVIEPVGLETAPAHNTTKKLCPM